MLTKTQLLTFKEPDSHDKESPTESIQLRDVISVDLIEDKKRKGLFEVGCKNKNDTFLMQVDESEVENWISAIELEVELCKKRGTWSLIYLINNLMESLVPDVTATQLLPHWLTEASLRLITLVYLTIDKRKTQ